MSVQSQDTYAAEGIPLSVIGSGGGSSNPNPQVSTISALGLLNVSSINGVPYVGAGGVPANLVVSSISTLALNSISSINGVPYSGTGGVPANLTLSTLTVAGATGIDTLISADAQGPIIAWQVTPDSNNTNSIEANADGMRIVSERISSLSYISLSIESAGLRDIFQIASTDGASYVGNGKGFTVDGPFNASTVNVSTINGISTDDIPYPSDYLGPADTPVFGASGLGGTPIAPLTVPISTIGGHRYISQGCFRLSSIGAGQFPAPGSAAAEAASIWITGGGGGGISLNTPCTWTYPQISSMYWAQTAGGGNGNLDMSWVAPGLPGKILGTSTITYLLKVSPDWPTNMYVAVSSIINNPATIDIFQNTTTDLGPTTFVP